jgi:hypothetical protein
MVAKTRGFIDRVRRSVSVYPLNLLEHCPAVHAL